VTTSSDCHDICEDFGNGDDVDSSSSSSCSAITQAETDTFGRHELSLDVFCTSRREEKIITLAGRLTLF